LRLLRQSITTGPHDRCKGYPTNITRTTSTVVQLHNVNDILYSYTVKSECTQNQPDPFGSIAGLMGRTQPGQPKVGATPCEIAIATAQTAVSQVGAKINEMINAPTSGASCSAASPCDISLAQTRLFWNQSIEALAIDADVKVKDAQNKCSSDPSNVNLAAVVAQATEITRTRDKVKSKTHDYSVTVTLLPDSSCQLTITQRYGSTQTQNGSEVATFSPGPPRLTLSAGPLFSQIQDRSYSVVTVPSSGSSTSSTQTTCKSTGTPKLQLI